MGKISSKLLTFVLINTILASSLFYLPNLGVKEMGWYSIFVWPALFILGALLVPRYAGLIQRFPSTGGTYDVISKVIYVKVDINDICRC